VNGRIWPALKQTVERIDTRPGRIFDLTIQALIVLSLITFAIETLPDMSERTRHILKITEVVVVLIFTAEYILRILVADKRLKFIFSFYGLVDLAAILPFYLATGVDLRSIRVIRLLRLFRILKIARYSAALQRFNEAFKLAREELILFLSASAIILYIASVGIYFFLKTPYSRSTSHQFSIQCCVFFRTVLSQPSHIKCISKKADSKNFPKKSSEDTPCLTRLKKNVKN